jgi:uncharacterized protein
MRYSQQVVAMRIELANLEQGRNTFSHDYAPGELLLEDQRAKLLGAPRVSGEILVNGKRVLIKGRVSGALELECDRCLKPIEHLVDSVFKVEYVTPEVYETQHAVELSEADLDLSVFDGETINVDDLVTEELMLTVPDHILCREDCAGICSTCGADKNTVACNCESKTTDPRWDELKKLIK